MAYAWWATKAKRVDVVRALRAEANEYASEALDAIRVMNLYSPDIPEERPAHVTADTNRKVAEHRERVLKEAARLMEMRR